MRTLLKLMALLLLCFVTAPSSFAKDEEGEAKEEMSEEEAASWHRHWIVFYSTMYGLGMSVP